MGQYDSICLFFLLLALLYYLDGRMWRFAFVMGFAVVCKMFALLVFLPLLVLREKKLHRIAALGALSLWLYIPTALLFSGRDGDMHVFNDIMVQRLFDAQLPGGTGGVPLFLTCLAFVCVICWLLRPCGREALADAAIHVCFTVFVLLFVFVTWHPQWLILLAPFAVLTNRRQQPRYFWSWLDLLFYAGFFLLCAQKFPGQLEGNLLDGGLLGAAASPAMAGAQTLSFYYGLLPWVLQLSPVLFAAPLLCGMVFKCPWRGGHLADTLTGRPPEPAFEAAPALAGGPAWLTRARCAVWLSFIIGYGGLWLAPCMFQWLKGWLL